jgi:class 3 adenylate cyclase
VEAFGIVHFMQIIHESKKLLTPIVDQYDGILLKMEGDSMLTLFKNPKKAVDCAVAMQREMKSYNVDKPETEKVLLCVGIGFGKILRIGDDDVFGEEVNSACKLGEDTAKAWEIMITEPVYNLLDKSKHYSFELMTGKTFSGKNTYKLVYSL